MRDRQRGFTLIEMLVVIHVIGVVAAVAVPNLISSRRSANGASAVEATRLFFNAEVTYLVGAGQGEPGSARDLFEHDLIDPALAGAAGVPLDAVSFGGQRVPPHSTAGIDGYTFGLRIRPPINVSPGETRFGWDVQADPVARGRSGDRSFFVDETGVIRFQPTCPPPQEWNPKTRRCERDFTDGLVIESLLELDDLTPADLLKLALAHPPDPGRQQQILQLMDRNGDGRLTLREVVAADIMKIARRVAGEPPDEGKGVKNRAVEQILRQLQMDLDRELALGIGNEGEVSLPFVELKGDVVPLLELAAGIGRPIKR